MSEGDFVDEVTLHEAGMTARSNYRQVLDNCWYINRAARDAIVHSTPPGLTDDRPYEYIETVRCRVSVPESIPAEFTGEHTIVGETQTKHFVTVVDSSIVDDGVYSEVDGYVFLDAALDQFCDRNYEAGDVPLSLGKKWTLDAVYVMPPEDERRRIYRDSIDESKQVRVSIPV